MATHGKPVGTAAALLAIAAAVCAMLLTDRSAQAAQAATGAACTASKGSLRYGIAGAGISQLDPNTINFAGQAPVATAGQPLFAPTTARYGGPRQLQLGARVTF